APVARIRFGTKHRQIFVVAPTVDVQAAGGREFESFADGQEHEAANTLQNDLATNCRRSLLDGYAGV
ncbi:MAG TPA: hypothetical protein VK556_08495, partial [Candidatus Udaeobacter sp.]|nr:hypothetical protein [Candidatus Udaeobacter sp.]